MIVETNLILYWLIYIYTIEDELPCCYTAKILISPKKKKSYHTPDYKTSDFSSQILLLVT